MTNAQLRAACKGGFALDESADDAFLTNAQWTRALNRGYRWICRNAQLIAGKWTLTSVNGTREYALTGRSPSIAGLNMALFKQAGTTWRPLIRLPSEQLAPIVSQFHDTTGTPTHYWTRSDQLGLYPIPDSTNAGAYLELWGWAYPTALSGDSDTPAIEESLHEWLIDPARYEMARQLTMQGRPDGQALVAMYDRARQEALAECIAYVRQLDDSPQYSNWAGEDF